MSPVVDLWTSPLLGSKASCDGVQLREEEGHWEATTARVGGSPFCQFSEMSTKYSSCVHTVPGKIGS